MMKSDELVWGESYMNTISRKPVRFIGMHPSFENAACVANIDNEVFELNHEYLEPIPKTPKPLGEEIADVFDTFIGSKTKALAELFRKADIQEIQEEGNNGQTKDTESSS